MPASRLLARVLRRPGAWCLGAAVADLALAGFCARTYRAQNYLVEHPEVLLRAHPVLAADRDPGIAVTMTPLLNSEALLAASIGATLGASMWLITTVSRRCPWAQAVGWAASILTATVSAAALQLADTAGARILVAGIAVIDAAACAALIRLYTAHRRAGTRSEPITTP